MAIAAQFVLPMWVTVEWTLQDGGVLLPTRTLFRPLVYLVCVGASALFTQIWKHTECAAFSRAWFPWWRAFHPRLAPWLELAAHLFYAWFSLSPLFAEAMILLFN